MRMNLLAGKAIRSSGMALLSASLLLTGMFAMQGRLTAADDDNTALADAEVEQAASGEADDSSRLPPYYGEVVTEAQKAGIYRVQSKYAEQIDALKAQLRKVVQQRDAEIEGMLSTEQKAKLKQIAADRSEERKILAKFREERAKQSAAEQDK